MDYVYCNCDECAYNRDRTCGKESISISWTISGEFRCGERVSYPVCEDYQEAGEDDDAD